MNPTRATEIRRREFMAASARSLLLGAVAACAALAGTRRQPAPDRTCVRARLCQGCSVFARCELPDALFAKRNLTGE